ncbi:MAG: hypothetical protein HC862_07205 [Scytonema sp. RU_4_4]|nr:hypothetical protein [Scytonema sp. RU_4_4]
MLLSITPVSTLGLTPSDFEMHVREEHSTFAWIIEGMLTCSGFEIEQVNYVTPEMAEYICTKTGV